MPMTNSGLSDAVKAAIIGQKGAVPPAGAAELQKFCDAIGSAVVSYIKANASVSTTITGTVTTGPGAGGVVTGSGSGTIA